METSDYRRTGIRAKAITFWGMTTTPDPTGSMQVKVQFPDPDTDPRGEICNGGGGNTSMCYNSYAAYLNFTTSWQQFTVLLDAGSGGVPPAGGIAIDGTWGYQQAQWIPTQVYGINWQAQRNIAPSAGPSPQDRNLGRRRVLRRVNHRSVRAIGSKFGEHRVSLRHLLDAHVRQGRLRDRRSRRASEPPPAI
jgi:hypothetical protein